MEECHHVKVGVAVFVRTNLDNKFILMKRNVEHGKGTWGLPGGHLEVGESIQQCAIREVKEELGVKLEYIKVEEIYTEDFFMESKRQYITFYVSGIITETPKNIEIQKCKKIGWYDFLNLPRPLFLPVQNYLYKYTEKIRCYSAPPQLIENPEDQPCSDYEDKDN